MGCPLEGEVIVTGGLTSARCPYEAKTPPRTAPSWRFWPGPDAEAVPGQNPSGQDQTRTFEPAICVEALTPDGYAPFNS